MTEAAGAAPPRPKTPSPSETLGRRVTRGLILALIIGFVGLVVGLAPAVFIQSVFVGSAQRCADLQAFEQAAFDEVRSDCDVALAEVPLWLPNAIILGGAIMGATGGFGFGFVNPPRRSREQERPWLPF